MEVAGFFEGGGGHVINITGAGKILGVPWISWTHDANQGFDNNGTPGDVTDDKTLLNGGVNWWDGGIGWSPVVNGETTFFLKDFHLAFAVSESIPEPMTLALLGAGSLTLLRRRQRG